MIDQLVRALGDTTIAFAERVTARLLTLADRIDTWGNRG